ncbi:MAG: J domain-containing protein [Anaerolineae bacterium]|nr:J domain-containing protein [Anaerolineae bacterium]
MDGATVEAARLALRVRLLGLVNVQACYLSREDAGQLIVQTWMNTTFYVRLVPAAVKPSAIKKVLKDATDVGIGTVFMVSRALLPDHNTRFSPPEWLMALHALTQERVYSLRLEAGEVTVGQVHFEPLGSTGEYGVKYGSPVNLDRMRFFRASVKPKVMKGDWQIVDFGSEAFWRDPHRPNPHQTNYYRPDPSEYSERAWKSWSGTTWDAPPLQDGYDPRQPRVAQDGVAVAYAVLKVEREASLDEVRAAYRKLAMAYHPDTSTLPKEEAAQKFRELNAAYEIIQKVRSRG